MGTLNIQRFTLLGALILHFTFGYSQGGLYEVSTNEKISNSTLIIEGKVVAQKGIWNAQHNMILTSNVVEVYKIFKGALQKNTINIITIGGNIGSEMIVASHQLALTKNAIGVFYCRQTPLTRGIAGDAYEVYSSSQGFLEYDLPTNTASSPFNKYQDVEHTLYPELFKKTGRKAEIKNRLFSIEEANKLLTTQSSNSTLAPVISSFSPASVEAGAYADPTNNVLTINGSGFGSSPSGSAAILFPDADKAVGNFVTMAYDTANIVLWTNTQIKVMVPPPAGTGVFQVRDASGNTATSATPINVIFAVLATYLNGFGPKQFNLINRNGTGGYNIKYSTNTANSGVDINASAAKATFQRALDTWKESAGVNFVEAGTTTLQALARNDANSVVMFDNGGTGIGPMPAGVLATCYSYLGLCGDAITTSEGFEAGFDIVIRNEGYSTGTINFSFGPCSPFNSTTGNAVDLETVVLHELGHALTLAHIIDGNEAGGGPGLNNPAKIMNYSVSYNMRRISLDYSAKMGAAYTVTPHGYSYGSCLGGSPEMVPLAITTESKDECPISFPSTATPLFSTVPFDLVHATSNKYVDPKLTQLTTDNTGTSITNTAYYAFKTNPTGGDVSLEVTNYTTNPTTLAACTVGTLGIPVTGVQMALYQVASCPGGQSFPTPVAALTFKTNGVLPVITGLGADQTYLMVLDGIENTKATFNIVFSGSALPLKFNDFAGEIFTSFNTITWKTDKAYEVESLNLERSSDGVTFSDIDVVTDPDLQADGSFNDSRFLPGANYYRLAVHNTNGSIAYSKVVVLTRTETFRVNVYPNPAVGTLNVEILSNVTGKYGIVLHNSLGQRVYDKQISVVPGNQSVPVDVTRFRAGVYHVTVYGEGNNKVKSATITIQN
ncbi:MAG: T9SS type A sorting domain-containing protein [Flavitalea sp.]